MNYDVELPTEGHDGQWLSEYGHDGALELTCLTGERVTAFLVSSGWAFFDYCPVCGTEIDLSTEEVA